MPSSGFCTTTNALSRGTLLLARSHSIQMVDHPPRSIRKLDSVSSLANATNDLVHFSYRRSGFGDMPVLFVVVFPCGWWSGRRGRNCPTPGPVECGGFSFGGVWKGMEYDGQLGC
jgi:hypothetical protein